MLYIYRDIKQQSLSFWGQLCCVFQLPEYIQIQILNLITNSD